MNNTHQRKQDSLIRSDDYIDSNGAVLGSVATSVARQALKAAIEAVNTHRVYQGSAERMLVGAKSRQEVLATQLIESHMKPIAQFAHGRLRGVPDFTELMVTVRVADSKKLLAAARTLAQSAAKYRDQFVGEGMAPDTIERLTAATNAYADAINDRMHTKAVRMTANKFIEQALSEGRDAVKVLGAQISQLLPVKDPILQTWRRVSRVERKGGKSGTAVADPSAKPATAAVAASATSSK
jgi:nucleotide-binding universal stress UspA family protein